MLVATPTTLKWNIYYMISYVCSNYTPKQYNKGLFTSRCLMRSVMLTIPCNSLFDVCKYPYSGQLWSWLFKQQLLYH